jgi:hypothetical protein
MFIYSNIIFCHFYYILEMLIPPFHRFIINLQIGFNLY